MMSWIALLTAKKRKALAGLFAAAPETRFALNYHDE
jgi:hypothetical protein